MTTEGDKTKSLTARLINVQMKLNAPKNQKNTFGNYSYRSAEDILEAVKPLLEAEGLLLTISDELENVGDRYYVKATAEIRCDELTDKTGNDFWSVSAYAREAEDKKGMDSAQVTGATSSYARKYALNGLFAIDDAKDADTDEHRRQVDNSPKQAEPTEDVLTRAKSKINDELEKQGYTNAVSKKAFITKVLSHGTIDNLNEADEVMDALENEASDA